MYNSARVISGTNSLVPRVNKIWEFPVIGGHNCLVWLHFCDTASISIGLINFNVYVMASWYTRIWISPMLPIGGWHLQYMLIL